MRVIAGAYRSRILTSPPGTATRPTSDRLRETLFNILGPRVPGSRFADLFAGTGAVGIEAISRGAAHTFFAEKAPAAVKALKTNLAHLQITRNYTLEDRGTMSLLARLLKLEPVNLIFLDPPYEDEDAYTQTLGFLGSPAHASILSPDALILAEHASKGFQPAERYGLLTRTRIYKQGDTTVSFYTPSSTENRELTTDN
jgi:16S rRNA (guanine(966)-N(2))-methyltransferase RsmD